MHCKCLQGFTGETYGNPVNPCKHLLCAFCTESLILYFLADVRLTENHSKSIGQYVLNYSYVAVHFSLPPGHACQLFAPLASCARHSPHGAGQLNICTTTYGTLRTYCPIDLLWIRPTVDVTQLTILYTMACIPYIDETHYCAVRP